MRKNNFRSWMAALSGLSVLIATAAVLLFLTEPTSAQRNQNPTPTFDGNRPVTRTTGDIMREAQTPRAIVPRGEQPAPRRPEITKLAPGQPAPSGLQQAINGIVLWMENALSRLFGGSAR